MSWWNNSTADDLRRRLGVLYAVSLLLIAGSVVAFQHYLPFGESLPLPDTPSLVVLPFVNSSDDPEQEYFSDGMAAEFTGGFSILSGLFVINVQSALSYRHQPGAVRVSREVGVRYVVKGAARKTGDRMEITVQLVDTTARCYLWAECEVWTERYDRPWTDLFAVEDEIVQKVVTTLGVALTPQEQAHLRRVPTENLEAYDYVLRGLYFYARFTEEANAQARRWAEKAIELDPQFAGAYTLLGAVYWQQWSSQWSRNLQTLRQAVTLAQQATALDDSRSDARVLLALAYLMEGQHDHALAEAEKAVSLNPNFADAYGTLGSTLRYAGQPEEAIQSLQTAVRLNPRHPEYYLSNLGRAYWLAGQHEEAVATYERALGYNIADLEAHIGLAVIASEGGQVEEAKAAVATIMELDPTFSLQAAAQRWPPYKDQAVLGRILTALQKAGLK